MTPVTRGHSSARGQVQSGELSASRFTMIIGVTAVLFFLGLLPLEAIPEIPVDIDSKPFFIPIVLCALLPAGKPGVAIGLGVALGEFLRDLMEGYELDDPIGFVGYFVAFALTSYVFGKRPPGWFTITIAGLFSAFVQALIEASSFLLFGEESFGIFVQSTIGNTIMHGVVWGAIPACLLVPRLKGRFERYLGFGVKGDVVAAEPLQVAFSGFTPAPDAVAWVSDLWFRYPSSAQPTLRGVSLDLRPGEVLGLMGPSHAGKSTLCRIVAGVTPRATGGEIVGQVQLGSNAVDIGYVADSPAAMMTRTHALSEVEAALEHLGLTSEERQKRASDALTEVAITPEEARRYIWELPTSLQMMVALAAAVASRPKLLVLDELAGCLSASGLAVLKRVIAAHCETGGAVLLVENDVDRLWGLTQRVALLESGRVALIGPTHEVLADCEALAAPGFTRPSALLAQDLESWPSPACGPASTSLDEALLKVDHVRFGYSDGDDVLEDVSFAVRPGEVIGLVGASGAGKTTLAKVLGGLLEPTSGSLAEKEAGVAVVMHEPTVFFSEVTIGKEIASVLDRAGCPSSQIDTRRADLASRFGLEKVLESDPSFLAPGTAKLAHIATTLANGAGVLVLDEAAAGLDPAERRRVVEAVHAFAKEGAGVIALDHDLEFLAQLADRVSQLHEGRLRSLEGTSEDVRVLDEGNLVIPPSISLGLKRGLSFTSREELARIAGTPAESAAL
ncbi:MAG: ATP-binding cassette domain-containing protein [Pseudomonadota bacterium]